MSATRARPSQLQRGLRASLHSRHPSRSYSTKPSPEKSPHANIYSDFLPGMVPVALLGSAVYLGLQLTRTTLSHDKFLQEARARITELEEEVEALQRGRAAPVVTGVSPAVPDSVPNGYAKWESPDSKSWGWSWGWSSGSKN